MYLYMYMQACTIQLDAQFLKASLLAIAVCSSYEQREHSSYDFSATFASLFYDEHNDKDRDTRTRTTTRRQEDENTTPTRRPRYDDSHRDSNTRRQHESKDHHKTAKRQEHNLKRHCDSDHDNDRGDVCMHHLCVSSHSCPSFSFLLFLSFFLLLPPPSSSSSHRDTPHHTTPHRDTPHHTTPHHTKRPLTHTHQTLQMEHWCTKDHVRACDLP